MCPLPDRGAPSIPGMTLDTLRRDLASWGFTAAALVTISLFVSLFLVMGADLLWLVPLGRHVWETGQVPDGVPFAAAPTDGWPNVLVLAEVVVAGLHAAGPASLAATQVFAGTAALTLVAWGARREGAGDLATSLVLFLVSLGSLTSLVIMRLQVFSLVPFALLLLLLRSDQRRPTRRLWLVPGLVCVWSNLHGAVLTGVGLIGAYLLFSRLRRRPGETVAVGVATLVAVLVTPAGWRTVPYYFGVLDNEAAARGTELWARPSLSNPFDLLLLLTAGALLLLVARRRRPLWEYVALGALAIGTITAARHGVWLLMTAAAPAALHATRRQSVRHSAGLETPPTLTPVLVCLLAVATSLPSLIARDTAVWPEDPALVKAVASAAVDRVVLAPEPLAESLAVEGVTVWVSDPIDAFRPSDQAAYLDFLQGGGPGAGRALAAAEVVVVGAGTAAEQLTQRSQEFRVAGRWRSWHIYERSER